MTVSVLFEGISDKDFFEIFFEDEMRQLRKDGIKVICTDYGGKLRRFTRRLPMLINSEFEIQKVRKVLVHIAIVNPTRLKE